MSLPILYSFRRCPYAMRARLAIQSARFKCRLREVVLRDKPAEMLEISPKATVPVLHLNSGEVIDESLDVMRHVLGKADPESLLEPETGTLDDMLALIAACDGPFKHHLDRYKYPDRYEGAVAADHRTAATGFLVTLNERLTGSAQLFGDRVSLADLAIMPFLRQFANTDRAWFDTQPYPALQRWLGEHLESQRFKAIMPKFAQWKTGDSEPVFPA